MNKLTQEIAAWLNISIEAALKVQSAMSIYWGADFSEDSTATLKKTARLAFNELRLNGEV
jgi:hypothetical protein